jgi:hypothetical protein
MPKATLKLPSGTAVEIQGTAAEIDDLLGRIDVSLGKKPKTEGRKSSVNIGKSEKAIGDYVLELREAGLFSKPQGLQDIRAALEREGHIIPSTTLSGVMLSLVKAKELRRYKEGKVWKYVKR